MKTVILLPYKENYTKTFLKNNDQIEIVTFIGGG